MNNPFTKFQLPFLKKTITLVLTPGKILLLGIIALGAIIWFFFLGLLLGRGEYPERAIPEISKMMPQSNGTETPLTVLTVEPTSEIEQRIAEKKAETKGKTEASSETKQETDTKKVTIKQSIKKQEPQKISKKTTQVATKKVQQNIPLKAGKKEIKIASKETSQSEDIFDYVYQVASFKDEKSANAFANRLKKSEIKARVASSKTGSTIWSRVVVDFRGTPNDTAKLREQLKPFKVDKMVMLKKKAVKK